MVSIFQIGISRNAKCAVKDGFCKSSHIRTYVDIRIRRYTVSMYVCNIVKD